MNEDVSWTREHEEHVEAYARATQEPLDTAAAFARFERSHASAAAPSSSDPRRYGLLFAIALPLAAATLLWLGTGTDAVFAQSETVEVLSPDLVNATEDALEAVSKEPPARGRRTSARSEPPLPPQRSVLEPEEPVEAPATVPPTPAPNGGKPLKRRGPQTPRKPAAPAPPSTLADELKAVASMRSALRRGAYKAVLRHVAEHERRFESPSLAAERDFLKLEALCGLDDDAALVTAKQAFASTHGSHHLATRARRVCGKKTAEELQTDGR